MLSHAHRKHSLNQHALGRQLYGGGKVPSDDCMRLLQLPLILHKDVGSVVKRTQQNTCGATLQGVCRACMYRAQYPAA